LRPGCSGTSRHYPNRFVIPTRGMGLRPTQGDEKRLLFSNYSPWKRRPPLCHLDRSAAEWRDLRFDGPFLGMFFDRGIMGLRPTQVDEKRFLFSNFSLWKRCPPLCHLDRSAAERRDLCVDALSWKCFSTEEYPDFVLRTARNDHVCGSPQREPHASDQRHGSRQEIRGKRSGGTCGCFESHSQPALAPNAL
jgi:hypothetical protein